MEGRGSLRQLHQQVSALNVASASDWPSAKPRPPPPSLPPWAGSFSVGADDGTGERSSWTKPKPLRGLPPKRLTSVAIPPLERRVTPPTDEPQPEERTEPASDSRSRSSPHGPSAYRPPRGLASVAAAASALQPQDETLQENQREDADDGGHLRPTLTRSVGHREASKGDGDQDGVASDALVDTSNQAEDAREGERAASAGFFRPWKKAEAVDSPSEDAQGNKWKVRALMNPFAKRKAAVKAAVSTSQPLYASEEPGSSPPRVDSPSVESHPTPRRPPTPSLSDPTLPAQRHPLRPRVLRSREGVHDGREDLPSEPQDDPRGWKPTAAPSRRHLESRGKDKEDDACLGGDSGEGGGPVPDWRARPALKPVSDPARGKKPKAAASTMDALADIKRKRDERRVQQAEEKRRIRSELEAHGDDSGYKFRRLIQTFRAALPAAQSAPVVSERPSTSASGRLPVLASASSPAATSPAKLFVFIRKRPLSKKELKAKGFDILTCLFSPLGAGNSAPLDTRLRRELLCHEPKLRVDCSAALEHHRFRFDGVFDDDQASEHVYAATVGPLIPFLLPREGPPSGQPNGQSSGQPRSLTVFAYGQTGSGKTFTMKSLYRQAAAAVFARLGERPHARVSVGVSFYEIYMNSVHDLLRGRARVHMMEDGDGTVQLPGLTELPAESADALLALVQRGEEARATSANAVHDDSSRSHALLRVTLYAAATDQQQQPLAAVEMARLSMVDLAGSERAGDTQSDSKNTRMEGAEINKSLLALKECIRALDRGASHIPFRQSKLTQLLRESFLSENSKTVMIATVSPGSESCNHTLNTLRYADRLKEIGGA